MIAREPQDLPQLFARYATAGELSPLLDLYELQAAFVRPDGTTALGHDAVRAHIRDLLTVSPKIVARAPRLVTAGDLAMICSGWQMSFGGDGGSAVEGSSTEVARRQADGSWRYVIDDPASATASLGSTHFTPTPPPSASA